MKRFLSICLALLIGGCAPRTILKLPPDTILLPPPELAAALETLDQSRRRVDTFKGLARAVIEQGSDKVALRYAFVYSVPGNLRIEALPLGAAYALSVLLVRDGKGMLLDLEDRKVYESERADALLRRFLQVPLDERDIAALLLGHLPPGAYDELKRSSTVEASRDPLANVLYISDRGLGLYFEVDQLSGLIRAAKYVSRFNDALQLEMSASGPGDVNGVLLWNRIQLSAPRLPMKISFAFSSQNVNDPLRDDIFALTVPSDFEVIEVKGTQD